MTRKQTKTTQGAGVFKLIRRKMPRNLPVGENGGCGTPTRVSGTSGMLPCGALLTMLGNTAPYYCGVCGVFSEMIAKEDGTWRERYLTWPVLRNPTRRFPSIGKSCAAAYNYFANTVR